MIELIKITERENGQKAVSARELHQFLESKRDFSNWIKDRIEKYDLMENVDYQILYYDYQGKVLNVRLNKNGESDIQRVRKIEYALSVDAAKELSMVEGNDKGKEARKYFIACEKIAHENLLAKYQADLLLNSGQRLYKLEQKVIADMSKVEWADKNQESEGLHTVTACVHDEKICADFMNQTLKHYKIQRKVGGEWVLTTRWQNKGFAETKPEYHERKGSKGHTTLHLKWSEKGRRLMTQLIQHAFEDGFLQIKKRTSRYTINKNENYSFTKFKFTN